MKNKILGIIFIVAALAAAVGGIYYWQTVRNLPVYQAVVHKDATAGWKTYTNTKYGFEIKYPNTLLTTVGPYDSTTNGSESSFSISNGEYAQSVNFIIAGIGSSSLGSIYQSAKNLDQYLALVSLKDSKGNIIRRFVRNGLVSGRDAKWYEVYDWNVSKQMNGWNPEVYFQDKNNIYEIYGYPDSFDQILATFKFTETSTSTTPPAGKGILTGHVSVGPICPVEQMGHPCPVPPEAYTARQVGVFTQATASTPEGNTNAKLVASQHLDANGNYKFDLAPGKYEIKASGMRVDQLTTVEGTVTIKAGETTTLDFSIDTGIR